MYGADNLEVSLKQKGLQLGHFFQELYPIKAFHYLQIYIQKVHLLRLAPKWCNATEVLWRCHIPYAVAFPYHMYVKPYEYKSVSLVTSYPKRVSAISPTPISPTYYHSVPFRLLMQNVFKYIHACIHCLKGLCHLMCISLFIKRNWNYGCPVNVF